MGAIRVKASRNGDDSTPQKGWRQAGRDRNSRREGGVGGGEGVGYTEHMVTERKTEKEGNQKRSRRGQWER